MLKNAFVLTLLIVAAKSQSDEVAEEVNKTLSSGKTYFIQFRRNNLYKSEVKPENIQQEVKKKSRDFINDIDSEWKINLNRSQYELPNITYELYEAMSENNTNNASIVRCFFEIGNMTSNVIKFNLSSIVNTSNVLIDAELHIYRPPTNESRNASDNVVRLYQLIDDNSNTTFDEHKLANVIYISSNYEGWQVFKVKNVVENWLGGEENLGFLLNHDDFVRREPVDGGKYQPVLVVYLNSHSNNTSPAILAKQKQSTCRRHVWYVSFHELGWNNFVILPAGFMAYKCGGHCTGFDTNYGKFAQMLNVKSPCCVPDDYRGLLMMFYDEEYNVVIKEYEDMIVNSCGCR